MAIRILFSTANDWHPELGYNNMTSKAGADVGIPEIGMNPDEFRLFGEYELERQKIQVHQHCSCKPGYPGRLVVVQTGDGYRYYCRGCETYGSILSEDQLAGIPTLRNWADHVEPMIAPLPK